MNTILGVSLLIASNLMLAMASFEYRTIFENADIDNEILPPLSNGSLILPGTKFCGIGTLAENDTELGEFNRTDKCCQSHADCTEKMDGFSTLHELFNPSILPRYDCKCEQKFMTCLKLVNDIPSMIIGQAYFGIINKCFGLENPAIDCIKYQEGILGKRCVLYKFDLLQKKTWQFFDLPFFTGV